jgi:signal transduction histidine kinase
MINQKLQEQSEKTDSLMNVFPSHDVLREMVRAEDECGGTIGAGFPAYSYNPRPADPEKLEQAMHRVRLLSLLFTELEVMMNQANLGAGTEAAIVEARQCIHEKLDHLSEEQKSYFDALVAEELSTPLNRPIHNQLKAKISSLLSVTDWNAIGQEATNALQTQWVEFIESAKSA